MKEIKESELVYQLAVKLFLQQIGRNEDAAPDPYTILHSSNWAIDTARDFVAAAKERGLISQQRGLYDKKEE